MNKKKIDIPTIVFIIVIIVGLSIMIYPVVTDFINTNKAKELISEYNNSVVNNSNNINNDIIEKANLYNQTLNTNSIESSFQGEYNSDDYYASLLNINNDGIMGYIKIPKIDVEIPIYHTTNDDVLQKGVGHFEGSSLPVGGVGTNSIIAGHRGLPSSKLFSDLNQVQLNDKFYIYVLDQVLAYNVDSIEVVNPEDISNLTIDNENDYVTLVTCTPYAINTHRLLVRGTRIPYNQEELNNIKVDRKLSTADVLFIVGLLIVLIMLVILYILIKIMVKEKKEKTMEIPVLKK